MKMDKSIQYALFSAVFAMIVSALYIKSLVDDEVERNKTESVFILENQAQKIQDDFIFTMEQVYQLRALVYGAKGLEIDPGPVLDRILENPVIRNVLYAPDGIVKKVIPKKGNEGVIGLDLLSRQNKSNAAAIQALRSGKLVLTGPYELKQGGKAFSGRVAIIDTTQKNSSAVRGLVSITVDFPDVIEKSTTGLLEQLGYEFTLLKKNDATQQYTPILASRTNSQKDTVEATFGIGNMKFCLRAAPRNGWFDRLGVGVRILSFLIASVTVGLTIGLLISARQRLIDKATRDPLTGIFNRTGAMNAIEKLQKNSGYKRGAVGILDLDNFKSVNDMLGHQTGDALLNETAKILKNALRDTDILSRLGGDEFMLYLPFSGDGAFIAEKMEEIRKQLKRTVAFEGKSVEVSSSIGVTLFDVGSKEMQTLYKEADEALYRSKEAGKNRVSFSPESRIPCP